MACVSHIVGGLLLLALSVNAATPTDKCMSMHLFQATYDTMREKAEEMNNLVKQMKSNLDQSLEQECGHLGNQAIAYPFGLKYCDFETGMCGYTQSSQDRGDWVRQNSYPDHTTGTTLGYSMRSYRSSASYYSRLVSPEFQPASAYCVRFFYRNPSTSNYTGNFSVYIEEGSGLGYPVWQRSVVSSNWTLGEFSPDPEYLRKPFKIVFEDRIGYYVLIDDIMVYNAPCNTVGIKAPLCPSNSFNRTDGNTTKCYTLHPEKLTWTDAIKRCKKSWPLASLVSITSAAESMFLTSLIVNNTEMRQAAALGIWTSGNDIMKEGSYTWAGTNGDPTSFTYRFTFSDEMLITSLILGNLILLAFSASTPKDKCMSMHVFQTTYNAVKEKIQEMNTLAERLKEKLDQSIDDTCESLANQVTSHPYNLTYCDFEEGYERCGYTQGTGDYGSWKLDKSYYEDHTISIKSGQLLQSYTTSNRYATRMVSPEFQPTAAYCIRFFYKTPYTGNYTGNFSIYLQEGADLGVPVWRKSIVTSNWTLGEFSPDPEYLRKPFKIVFEDKGNHYILIDDIMVYNVGCNSLGVRSPICPTNSYKITDGQTTTCYTLHLEPLTWRDAILRCKEFWPLSSLVAIETAAEDLFIRNIVANGTDLAAAADFGLWTRGNDIDKEGNFVWAENHGQPKAFSYSNWRSGQPNNIGDDQDCVLLQYPLTGLKWSDVNCSEKHSFICEATYSHVTGHSSIGNPFG